MTEAGTGSPGVGPIIIRRTFNYQSYFDNTALERAILASPPAEPIIPSTVTTDNTPGYGVALYQASESPVAVQFLLGGSTGKGKSGSATFVLRPGEVYHGLERFDAIRYGLPQGWLGGGTVQLRVLQGPGDKELMVSPGTETMIQRIRLPIVSAADTLTLGARGTSPNWPLQFPWINSFDFNNNPQKNQPLLVVDPTKTIMRLRKINAAPAVVRALWLFSDDFDLQKDGVTYDSQATSGSFYDIQFPSTVQSGLKINPAAAADAEMPMVTLNDEVTRIGGGACTLILIDLNGTLGSSFAAPVLVDIERFAYV